MDIPIICPYFKWWANSITWPNTKSQAEPIDPNTDAALPHCRAADPPGDLCEQLQGFSAEGPRGFHHHWNEMMSTGNNLILASLSHLGLSCNSSCFRHALGQMGQGKCVRAGNVPDKHAAWLPWGNCHPIRSLAVRPTEAGGFQHGGLMTELSWEHH